MENDLQPGDGGNTPEVLRLKLEKGLREKILVPA
jgi:hypothetical protein